MSRDKHIEIALQDAERYARPHMDQGKVATYIPELAKGDPTKLGICIRTPDGEEYCQGDCQTEFSIQSISKTITLILALQTAGYDRVFSKVGMEPTRRRLQLHDPAGDPDHPPHEPHDQRRGLPPPAAASRAAPSPSGVSQPGSARCAGGRPSA